MDRNITSCIQTRSYILSIISLVFEVNDCFRTSYVSREKESTVLLLFLTFTAMHTIQEEFPNWMILSQAFIAHA